MLPIDEVIATGAPRELVRCARESSLPRHQVRECVGGGGARSCGVRLPTWRQSHALWVLANLASGTPAQTAAVVGAALSMRPFVLRGC